MNIVGRVMRVDPPSLWRRITRWFALRLGVDRDAERLEAMWPNTADDDIATGRLEFYASDQEFLDSL